MLGEPIRAPRGELWDHILTETDGPELELMSGAYSDNQPDYSWLQPLESKIVRIHWFPIRGLGGLKFANLNGAANLGVSEDEIFVALNTVETHRNALATLSQGDDVLLQKRITIGPAQPFAHRLKPGSEIRERDLEIVLTDSSGAKLLSYRNRVDPPEPMPDPVTPPARPEEIESVEEVYLAGLRLEQFFNPALEPESYYEEALRRDPGHYGANVALGIRCFKQGKFEKAEKHFRTAVERVTHKHTSRRHIRYSTIIRLTSSIRSARGRRLQRFLSVLRSFQGNTVSLSVSSRSIS